MATATLARPAKEGLSNPFRLPRGERLRREVVAVFGEQRRAIIRWVRTGEKHGIGDLVRGGIRGGLGGGRSLHHLGDPVYLGRKDRGGMPLPAAWPDWHDFGLGALDISQRMTPMLTLTWEAAAAKFAPRVGLDPNAWEVVNPHTERMIDEAALSFCESTNETTSLQLDEALAQTRAALNAGVVQAGEALPALTKRINAIFDGAETWRARRIAWTETSRAVHSAQEQAAIASGVVTGWKWLLSSDACPICYAIAARCPAVRLGQPFAVIGNDPHYATVKFPPAHPHCNCALVEVLDIDEQPEWGPTLHDPGPATEEEEEAVGRQLRERDERIIGRPPERAKPKPVPRPIPKPRRRPTPKPAGAVELPAPIAAIATPAPAPKPWAWGEVFQPDRPIAERIKASPAWERVKELQAANAAYLRAFDAERAVNAALESLKGQAIIATRQDIMTDEAKAALLAAIKAKEAELKPLKEARKEASRVALEETARILAAPKGGKVFTWKADDSGLTTDSARLAAIDADIFLHRIVAAGAGTSEAKIAFHTIPAAKEQRAHCKDWLGEVHLKQVEQAYTAVHEWGHQVEHSVPGVRAATEEFLGHRVGNEVPRKLNDVIPGKKYEDHELGREDDFGKAFGELRWYVGKQYKDASEVISMGLEKLYLDPAGFSRDDPEYCAFILGILDGSLRKP